MADTLDDAAVADRLRDLPAWSRDGDEIRRRVKAPSFLAGIDVVTDVARAAEDADHHPDIDIRWRTLTFALTTHSAGGLTGKDFDLAATIDEIAARHGAE
ncbi:MULTISPECIES: 4a-hydroxytetrahydrobiopterin dehydratase [Actinomadura]|uniref:Putative pterin-4-alpha-carbinolamine dehydratase n=1 Tax=Actinomadura madurae TaxID=1993 RepID=A0A1I5JQ31_9ACTN|nr:4a-hydroxytetrahydrobiopterin dehydratase [Actinomadura madurae]SFO74898.1 4a-hydroxytetrahydrobiopterin dehydratase [Actinomadura madurae]SPT64208.1 Putative pterin-4-alpha-carbinolamine dehydratase [Actinomadura madurae]